VKLLVEKITVDRDEHGRAEVHITYRFGPPRKSPLVLWMVYGIPVFRDGIKACLPAVLATGRLRVSVKKQGKEECLR
jgi:hypothetical protein